MVTLTEWKAKRAGGRITITGVDEANNERKFTGVDFIHRLKPTFGRPEARTIAVIKSGEQIELA